MRASPTTPGTKHLWEYRNEKTKTRNKRKTKTYKKDDYLSLRARNWRVTSENPTQSCASHLLHFNWTPIIYTKGIFKLREITYFSRGVSSHFTRTKYAIRLFICQSAIVVMRTNKNHTNKEYGREKSTRKVFSTTLSPTIDGRLYRKKKKLKK